METAEGAGRISGEGTGQKRWRRRKARQDEWGQGRIEERVMAEEMIRGEWTGQNRVNETGGGTGQSRGGEDE